MQLAVIQFNMALADFFANNILVYIKISKGNSINVCMSVL